MKTTIRSLSTAVLVCVLSAFSPAFGQHGHGEEAEGHSHTRSESHGGSSTMTEDFHFETVFHDDHVMIYIYDGTQNPLDAQGVTGTVEIEFRDRDRQPLQVDLAYAAGQSDGVGALRGELDLSQIADGQAKAKVALQGLSGNTEQEVAFRETVRLAGDGDDHGDDPGGDHGDDHGHGH